MSEIPVWFGQEEFYLILYTVWFFLIVWLFSSLTKIGLDWRHLLAIFVFPVYLQYRWKLRKERKKHVED